MLISESVRSNKLRICLVAKKFPLLGQAATHGFLWPIAKGLAKDHEITVLSYQNPQGKSHIKGGGINAFYLGHNCQTEDFQFMVDQKFSELHAKDPFDIVHSVDDGGLNIGLKKKKYNVTIVYGIDAIKLSQIFSVMGTVQESLKSFIRTALVTTYIFLRNYYGGDRRLLKTADGIIVTNPQERIALERHYLYPALKISLIPYGVEIHDLSPRGKPEELRKRLNIPGHAQTIVTVTDMSGISEMKSLLQAFEKTAIKKRSARLVIIGDGPYFKPIERIVLGLALSARVTFIGTPNHSDLLDYISLADVFIKLNSRVSGIDPSMIEAMAQKRIVICSDVSPVAHILDNGVDGFALDPTDISTLYELFINILNETLPTVEIGEKARQKVMDLFDTKKMVEHTVLAYRKALSKKKTSSSTAVKNR